MKKTCTLRSAFILLLLAVQLSPPGEADAQVIESIPFEMVALGPSAQQISFDIEQAPPPEVPASCLDILAANPDSPSGLYEITTPLGPVEVHCDMEADGGGYTTLAIDEGARTARSTDPNDCQAMGMDIVIPRSREHWASLLALYDTTYFTTVPGITKPTPGGSFTNIPMNHAAMPSGGYQALDGLDWWLRDTPYTEPNGDYTQDCWLLMNYWVLDDLRFNDANCSYSTTRYICSTNDKTSTSQNEFSRPVPLGFEFSFFGQRFDTLRISSHGRLTFDTTLGACCDAEVIPNRVKPDNIIAGYWSAMDIEAGGQIRVETQGEAPERRFVVEYRDVPHANGGNPVTLQIILSEEGERVEVHCEDCPSGGALHTQGVEGPLATLGASLRGRNLAAFDLSRDAVVFFTDRTPPPDENWSIVGRVTLDPGSPPAVIGVFEDPARTLEVERAVLLSDGIYSLPGLNSGDWHLRAFIDEDGDGEGDPTEPRLDVGPITLPPDALEVDFDFRTAPPTADAGVDVDDGEAARGDAEDGAFDDADEHNEVDPDSPDDEGSDGSGDQGQRSPTTSGESAGCTTSTGHTGASLWGLVMLAWMIAMRRRRSVKP